MRRHLSALLTGALLVCAAASGQAASDPQLLPYTAKFKTTTVKTLADGSNATSVSTEIDAVDSHGHRLIEVTEDPSSPSGRAGTQFHVTDRSSLTTSYWSVPGTSAMVVHMPDLGDPDNDCAKKMKAIDALHPVSAESSRGEAVPIQDLGAKTILGIEARGGQVTFTSTFFRPGESGPAKRTNEVWTAIDPRLDKLVVRTVSTTSHGETTTRELVEFKQAEPDPSIFQLPADLQITKREGHAYSCGIYPQPKPAPAQ